MAIQFSVSSVVNILLLLIQVAHSDQFLSSVFPIFTETRYISAGFPLQYQEVFPTALPLSKRAFYDYFEWSCILDFPHNTTPLHWMT